MNQKQREYAICRVNEVLKNKKSELDKVYKIPDVRISLAEARELLADKGIKWTYHDHPRRFIDFSDYESSGSFTDGYQEAVAVLEKEALNIKDAIMLGDSEEALEAINKFERS